MDKYDEITEQAMELSGLISQIKRETDDEKMLEYLNLTSEYNQKCVQAALELVERSTKSGHDIQEQCKQLAAMLQEERREHEAFYDNLCLTMIINPRGTFENILKQVERKKKAEESDGWGNWQWTLKFRLFARVRMAFKLIFGNKERLDITTNL